jgi:nitroreductase/NAD-dependent dihydropyrimidine dehydrogenase PreA subunit
MPIMHSIYRESGNVRIDPGTCTQCGACAKICPSEVLTMNDGKVRVHSDTPLGCIACGHCMMVCPNGAVTVTGRGISPEDLSPLPEPDSKAGADELAALMHARRSVRRFTDQEVDAKLLERIVELAATAPMGIPPWDVGCVAVRGREEVQRITAEVIKGYEGFLRMFKPWVFAVMRPFVGRAKYDMFAHFVRPLAEKYVQGCGEGRDLLFYNAPALLIFHHSPYADVVDAAIACTYAMLAAESLGLGSTIIGGAPPILQRNKALCQRLGVPPGNTPSFALILGHPATHFRRTIRRRFTHVGTVC